MRSGLYYPHTSIANENVMKTALLLWDHIEHIIPWNGFKHNYSNPDMEEAAEIIARPHLPSRKERERAHNQIEELATRGLPDAFYFQSWEMQGDYEIYPQKFLPDTFDLLRQAQMAGPPRANANLPLSQLAGLSVMSILGDCCAGTTLARITDEGAAYATVASLLQGTSEDDLPPSQSQSTEQFISITTEIIDCGRIDLKRLIAFRKREAKSGGHGYRDLRHRYVDRMETFLKTLVNTKHTTSDYEEISRQLRTDMKDDILSLREGLEYARNDVLFSKDIIAGAVAGLGSIAASIFGGPHVVAGITTALGAPVMIGGLLGSRNKFLSTRKAVMQKHPMAYLYELQGTGKVFSI